LCSVGPDDQKQKQSESRYQQELGQWIRLDPVEQFTGGLADSFRLGVRRQLGGPLSDRRVVASFESGDHLRELGIIRK
jgi:hypothetical protein